MIKRSTQQKGLICYSMQDLEILHNFFNWSGSIWNEFRHFNKLQACHTSKSLKLGQMLKPRWKTNSPGRRKECWWWNGHCAPVRSIGVILVWKFRVAAPKWFECFSQIEWSVHIAVMDIVYYFWDGKSYWLLSIDGTYEWRYAHMCNIRWYSLEHCIAIESEKSGSSGEQKKKHHEK